jgi:hypothetical protein
VSTLAGPFLVTVALLLAGGALKVVRPAFTARAMREMGLRVSPTVVRAGAMAELAVAAGALVGGGRPLAALVAASYAGFAAFVLAALRRGVPLSSCGCFGADDTPPTIVHLVLNVAAALVAGAVAVGGSGAAGLAEVANLDGSVLLRVAFLASTAVSVWLAYVALAILPKVQATR